MYAGRADMYAGRADVYAGRVNELADKKSHEISRRCLVLFSDTSVFN